MNPSNTPHNLDKSTNPDSPPKPGESPSNRVPSTPIAPSTPLKTTPLSMAEKNPGLLIASILGVVLLALVTMLTINISKNVNSNDGDTVDPRQTNNQIRLNTNNDRDASQSSTKTSTDKNKFQDPDQNSVSPKSLSGALIKRTVPNAQSSKAICNDGTDYTYYTRPGSPENSDRWIVYFQGGAACSSVDACTSRAEEDPDLITADTQASRLSDGILSRDESHNPDFNDWSHVFLPYCSSDTWAGDTTHQIASDTWYFYGHHIVTAVVDELLNGVGDMPKLSDSTDLMVVGSSAGGGGVQLNLDRISETVHAVDSAVRITGVLDSVWGFLVEPYASREDAYGNVLSEGEAIEFHNTIGDQSCEAASSANDDGCKSTDTLLPYLSTPVFIYIDQRDSLKLSRVGIDNMGKDPAQRAYWEETWQPNLLASLEGLTGLFAPVIGKHTSLTSDRFYTVKIDGLNFADVLGNWYFDRSGPKSVIAEQP